MLNIAQFSQPGPKICITSPGIPIFQVSYTIYNIYIILLNMPQIFCHIFQVRSRYFNSWQSRHIAIELDNLAIGISQPGNKVYKYFKLVEVSIRTLGHEEIEMETRQGRRYQIRGKKCENLVGVVRKLEIFQRSCAVREQGTKLEVRNIDYWGLVVKKSEQSTGIQEEAQERRVIQKVEYLRQKSYLIQKDWAINTQDGGLTLISAEKKQNQGKIIKFIVKKFITSGSFMGISFPVFAMKPESILETYCKSMAAAPLIFQGIPRDPTQRIKKFIAFVFSFSRLFSDMDKPFNPTIGETFQADIAGNSFSAEQTSHHPPQSSILLEGKGYRIYATLELVASVGLNSATGLFMGDATVEFEDGGRIVGRLLSGEMRGFVLGENRFKPSGSNYAYDLDSGICCMYSDSRKDVFKGHIGKLKPDSQKKFRKIMQDKERFTNFQAFSSSDYEQKYSQMQACWTKDVQFDNKTYINFTDPAWFPFEPQRPKLILDSDSRYRRDILLRAQHNNQQSQEQKQRIEQEQREYRKFRNTFKNQPRRH